MTVVALTVPSRRVPAWLALGLGAAVLAVLAAVHVTQGTAGVLTWDIFVGSRLPRLAAGIMVGLTLGASGAAMQSITRNHLASPDLLGVSAGGYLAVTAAAALGLRLPVLGSTGVAFAGGLLAAGLVLVVAAGGSSGPTRLVLAGSATAIALGSLTTLLLLLFEEETRGLFAWGSGSLLAVDTNASRQMIPLLVIGVGGLMALGRRLDILAVGDDSAAALGVSVRSTRLMTTVLAVLLAAAAVSVAGPIGFVGLCAPVVARLAAGRSPNLLHHRTLLPLSALAGALIVIGSDVALRMFFGSQWGVEIPTGVVTTLWGSVALVALARQHRDSGPATDPPRGPVSTIRNRNRFLIVVVVMGLVLIGAAIAGILLGGRTLLLGDLALWWQGNAPRKIGFTLDERLPRVGAAILSGGAMALAGSTVQSVFRNPLAEPGILGVTAGAGFGAVLVAAVTDSTSVWTMAIAATVAAALTFALLYRLSWRDGINTDRLVLIGIGVSAGLGALTVMVIVATDPWNTPKALTWLSGSTYARRPAHLIPAAIALATMLPALIRSHRHLDVLAVDDDVPRVLGMRLERVRFLTMAATVALTSAAVVAIGVVAFVGLVAPHAARALVGGRSLRVMVTATLLGATLVSMADTIGRTVISPAQVPAGLITALVGAPYFVWLLWRSRRV